MSTHPVTNTPQNNMCTLRRPSNSTIVSLGPKIRIQRKSDEQWEIYRPTSFMRDSFSLEN